ncbi:twin-arginine translocation signal domain-containing protein [Rhodococcus sp. PAM 2766]|uniref:Twin-arginine translocation signal domain-containing protein n=1 Tax=Rhodococcus parequi TaxID=3137122 RepID=A0ABW9FAM3_9NOCA
MTVAARSMRSRRHFVAASGAIAASVGIVLAASPPAHAAPTDYQFPNPVVGIIATAPPWYLASNGGSVAARTDPTSPGITRFVTGAGCSCIVQWRNLTTGATGVSEVGWALDDRPLHGYANTGSGMLVASVWPDNSLGRPAITILPTAGSWTVP